MIISTARWGVWVVWLGSLGTALGHSDHQWDNGHTNNYKPTTTHNMVRQSDEVFVSTWSNLTSPITLGTSYTFDYTFEFTPPQEFQMKAPSLTLILCYATNYKTGLSSSTVFEAMATPVNCE
jgi:hypothetical protein